MSLFRVFVNYPSKQISRIFSWSCQAWWSTCTEGPAPLPLPLKSSKTEKARTIIILDHNRVLIQPVLKIILTIESPRNRVFCRCHKIRSGNMMSCSATPKSFLFAVQRVREILRNIVGEVKTYRLIELRTPSLDSILGTVAWNGF
jgi:hypothetical protein